MIFKNFFSKKKINKMNIMKKNNKKKKNLLNIKKYFFFCKDFGIYGVFCICYRLI